MKQDPNSDYWVFGYGSLMWNPGFPHIEARPGLLRGYHRGFCIFSYHYRGTEARPGLVLGLDRGGSCHGVVFRVAPEHAEQVKTYLWDREMLSNAYHAKLLGVTTAAGTVMAQAFVANRANRQYAGKLPADAAAALIATSMGARGANTEYLDSTLAHLRALDIHDGRLEALATRVRALMETGAAVRPDLASFAGPAV